MLTALLGFFSCIRKHQRKINLLVGFAWKNAAIVLSLGNMITGLSSIFCSFNRKPNSASWLLLISFLFSLASGAVARLGICSNFKIPFVYQGLPCSYASSLLVSTFLLTNGNKLILFGQAVLMMSFMADRRLYPHDKTLESHFWKKVVFALGAMMLWHSFYMTPFYFLIWSSSYIFVPAIWGKKVTWPPAPGTASPSGSAFVFTE
ncbi:transmembrane protein 269 isoform X4 [Monodelphis domestica]|uniref:transmembrane protein 269 isoform X4 n=1 Tax=Monodelphis domestica TaxID=13616 RepID=UPI0024E21483|nr:transmembrane protein 269 isoform X4 [Monodelphis domestica]